MTTWLPATPEQCFTLSLSVDAHLSSMSGSGERVVGGVRSGTLVLGDEVTWRARHFGLPFTMTSRITSYERPRRFVDEQVAGPFRTWWHEHTFEPHSAGTLMTDRALLASPAGPLGRLTDRLVLTRYMTRLLRQRNAWLAEALAGEAQDGHPT